MSPRSPTVQNAMWAVSRKIKMQRLLPRHSTTATTPGPCISPFVSPIIWDMHVQMKSASSSPAPQTHLTAPLDLVPKLRSLLQTSSSAMVATSPTPFTPRATGQMTPTPNTNTETSRDRAEGALLLYNPTLDSAILRRVAGAVDVDGALKCARSLVQAIRDGGDFCRILSGLEELQPKTTIQELELQAGIAARLHQGNHGNRSHRMCGFRLQRSDVQVAEVLPSGKVVTFVNPTLPGAADISCCESAGEAERYLHFVLYKEGLSLFEAFRLLSAACGETCLPQHFAVNVALEESAVTVQVCSLCVPCSNTASYKTHREAVMRQLLQVNMRPLQLSLQVLGWRSFPCDPSNSQRCQMQYSVLVRGITTSTTSKDIHLEKRALTRLAVFPNYFGPHHFGRLSPFCPFRFYHAAAAMERNMTAEALVIAACLSHDATLMIVDGWVNRMVELLQRGEDRPAVLGEWYQLHVPGGLRMQIDTSKASLVWNVLASCRIRELGEGAIDGLPESGDFVLRNDGKMQLGEVVAKPELFPDTCLKSVGCGHGSLQNVLPIFTGEEAASFALRDVVIPFNVHGNETINQLSQALGFSFFSRGPVYFRPLLAAASGHPHATRPWVKALPELCSVTGMGEDAVYKLLTDMELRQRASYTAPSRGQSCGVWAIGKHGHRLVERLPAGALTLASSDTTQQHSTKCLALHFTLPAHTYSMAFFREFMVIEDCANSTQRFFR